MDFFYNITFLKRFSFFLCFRSHIKADCKKEKKTRKPRIFLVLDMSELEKGDKIEENDNFLRILDFSVVDHLYTICWV